MAYRAAGNDAGATNPIVSYDPTATYSYNGTTWVKSGGTGAGGGTPQVGNPTPGSGGSWANYHPAVNPANGPQKPPAAAPGSGSPWGISGAFKGPSSLGSSTTSAPFSAAYGSESGPGILEQRFNNRLNGTDPAYNYAVKRGMTDLDNRYSAAGSFNSGAARQGESDLVANLTAKSQSELDALAGGASGEHQGKVNSMFSQGLGIAGGQAGLAGSYDLGAGNALSSANMGALMMALQKAGVDSQAAQGFINNLLAGVSALKSK